MDLCKLKRRLRADPRLWVDGPAGERIGRVLSRTIALEAARKAKTAPLGPVYTPVGSRHGVKPLCIGCIAGAKANGRRESPKRVPMNAEETGLARGSWCFWCDRLGCVYCTHPSFNRA